MQDVDDVSVLVLSPDPGGFPHALIDDVNAHRLSSRQLFILKLVSVIAGSISVVSAVSVLCFFFHMRRRFRHKFVNLSCPSAAMTLLTCVGSSCCSCKATSSRLSGS